MGCTSSKAEMPSRLQQQDFAVTGAGSFILASPGRKVPALEQSTSDDLLQTRGGSMIVGRKEAGAWEPGSEIVRPLNTTSSQTAYMPLENGNQARLTYAVVSLQGRSPRPPHKPNQDSFVVSVGLGNQPGVALFAVFDGHGPKGEDVSNYCRINVPDLTVRHANFSDSPFEALVASFEAAHKKFTAGPATQRSGVDTQVSGTTAVAVMLHGLDWVCANVGDSRAALGSRADSPNGLLQCRPLSSDHKPSRADEKARILKSGARILSEKQLGIENGDMDKLYVCRVANGAIRYGVLFTRSIGDADAHANLGLLATPEIRRGTLSPLRDDPQGGSSSGGEDAYLVLATDGVWDHLDEEDVNRIILQSIGKAEGRDIREDVQVAAESLCEIARSKWDGSGDRRRDDITIILVAVREVVRAAPPAAAASAAGDACPEKEVESELSTKSTPILVTEAGSATPPPVVVVEAAAGTAEQGRSPADL